MGIDSLFLYQNFIVLIILLGGVALLYALVHSGKRRWISAGLTVLCVATTVWYFSPFHVKINGNHLTEVRLIYGGVEISDIVSDEQSRELAALCSELTYVRQVGQSRLVRSTKEYIYVHLRDGRNEVQLELAVSEDGFLRYPGLYGVTYGMDRVKNAEPLIAYIKSIVPEEVIQETADK